MNKLFITLLFFLLLSFDGIAQVMAGSGASYGDEIKQFAPNFRLYYFPNHKICFGPEFALFPSKKENGVSEELVEWGFSGHYIFPISEHLAFYPLVGLNYAVETISYQDVVEETTSFGANLGAGFHLEYGSYFPFVEYKYVASELAQNVISLGVLINLKKPKKEAKEH